MPSLWLNSLYCLDLSVSFFCYQSLSLSRSLFVATSCWSSAQLLWLLLLLLLLLLGILWLCALPLTIPIDDSEIHIPTLSSHKRQFQFSIGTVSAAPRSATGSTHSAATRLQCYQSLYLRLCLCVCLCQQPASLPSCHLEAADARYKLSINIIRDA